MALSPHAANLASLLGNHIDRTARDLTRDWIEPKNEIDFPATVDATARAGGNLTLINEVGVVRPHFVALVETTSCHDHQAALADAILTYLQLQGVAISRFAFRPDSELLLPVDGGHAVWLDEVLDRQHQAIWVFGDGAWLLSRGRALLELARYRKVILYTSLSADDWSGRERYLTNAGVAVMPAAEAWLRRGAGQEQPATRHTDPLPRAPLPRTLAQEAWVRSFHTPPKDFEVESVLTGLRAWLDDSAQWLCSLATLPVLRWPLTLSIGSELRDDAGQSILNGERLASLARLPWLRIGSMPDWLRERLLRDLSEANVQIVRSWIAWRVSFEPGPTYWKNFEMEGLVPDRIFLSFLHDRPWIFRLITKVRARIGAVYRKEPSKIG